MAFPQDKVRLTTAQAVVQVPVRAVQRARRRGAAFHPRDFRYFRPWERGGTGPGALRVRAGPDLPSALQRAVHGAHGVGLRQGEPPHGHDRVHGIHRSGIDQHAVRRGHGHDQPPARAPASVRLLRHPVPGPRAAAVGAPGVRRGERQRLLPAGQPVLRPDQPARATAYGPAGSHARAHRSGRNGRRDDLAAAGRAGPCLRFPPPICSRSAPGAWSAGRPRRNASPKRSRCSKGRSGP